MIGLKNDLIKLKDIEYLLIRNDDNCFDYDEVLSRVKETDYFDDYDYIMGDYAYDKVRLKGYYDSDNKKSNRINDIKYIDDYIKNYCQYGSSVFILKKN